MGCDIHWCLEVKTSEGWLGILQSDGSKCEAADRNYRFFAELAGVRRYDDDESYPAPKGLPEDISHLTRYSQEMGCWDHSHSWSSLEEFVAAYNRAAQKWPSARKSMCATQLFGLDYWPFDRDAETRVVFAFDN